MKRHQRVVSLFGALLIAVLAQSSTHAATNNLTVSGLADVWLAGQPNGTVLSGGFPSNDVAPTNSPVLATTGLNMTAGSFLTFSATGSTNFNGCSSPSPDGDGGCGTYSTGPALGISTFAGPANALIGVFLDNNVPSGAAPAGLNFTTGASQSQTSYSPLLNQVFFIGDGLTGTGTGTVQTFVIPAGATRLFLGSADAAGANYNNTGSFSVAVTDSAPVPVAPWFVVLLTAIVLMTFALYRLRMRAAA